VTTSVRPDDALDASGGAFDVHDRRAGALHGVGQLAATVQFDEFMICLLRAKATRDSCCANRPEGSGMLRTGGPSGRKGEGEDEGEGAHAVVFGPPSVLSETHCAADGYAQEALVGAYGRSCSDPERASTGKGEWKLAGMVFFGLVAIRVALPDVHHPPAVSSRRLILGAVLATIRVPMFRRVRARLHDSDAKAGCS